ncbi:hypothetical protein K443DRAFT_676272 [Laccaria amethystina LaAM-08-1]|uniref:Uncharacterized protein n=1 Tax=Laccaria amethystina LaAM-08-1 TaxID=1095629 RepID=A0A0C9Y7C7_9AGAR|nr:hypothetical protein K443DRAFT_676272 [Laccaria amethystina LaAM-08-1]
MHRWPKDFISKRYQPTTHLLSAPHFLCSGRNLSELPLKLFTHFNRLSIVLQRSSFKSFTAKPFRDADHFQFTCVSMRWVLREGILDKTR